VARTIIEKRLMSQGRFVGSTEPAAAQARKCRKVLSLAAGGRDPLFLILLHRLCMVSLIYCHLSPLAHHFHAKCKHTGVQRVRKCWKPTRCGKHHLPHRCDEASRRHSISGDWRTMKRGGHFCPPLLASSASQVAWVTRIHVRVGYLDLRRSSDSPPPRASRPPIPAITRPPVLAAVL
jgi:hypothetical protein